MREKGVAMSIDELEQLNDLRKEITALEHAITQIRQRQQKSTTAIDKVRASGKEFPYIDGYKQITGVNQQEEQKHANLLIQKEKLLDARKKKAEETEFRIIEYINDVQDSRIRMIMQYRYIDGYRWHKIAKLLQYDSSYPKKLVICYLKQNERK